MSATTTETTVPFKIIVVGAGIAGLAVSHALNRAKAEGRVRNLSVVIYEQRKEESSFQKYPIHIAPDGRSALQALLSPEDLEHLLTLSNHGINHGGIHILTQTFSRLFGVRRYQGEQPQFVHRWVLKEVLEYGINRPSQQSATASDGENFRVRVERGRRVVRIHEDAGTKIGVTLDSDVTEYADLVIGADGLGSSLRAQLSPSHTRFPLLPYLVISMKLCTPLPSLPLLPDKNGINMVLGSNNYSILLVPFHGTPLPPMPVTDEGPFAEPQPSNDSSNDPIHEALNIPTPEYVFVNFTVPSFEGWEDLTGPSWIAKLIDVLKSDKAHGSLIQAFEKDVIPGTVGAWQIVSCDETNPVPWEIGRRVVLIGDAAHVMPPQGGAGGSTALKDAELLTQALLSSEELGGHAGPLDTLLQSFHQEMTNRSHGLMIDAKRRLYLSHKSGIRVYTRLILLKAMDWIWPLANWVLNRNREKARTAVNQVGTSKKTI